MLTHKERYKSVQVNMSRTKHEEMIEWLIKKASDEETSMNAIIVRSLKKEFERCETERLRD